MRISDWSSDVCSSDLAPTCNSACLSAAATCTTGCKAAPTSTSAVRSRWARTCRRRCWTWSLRTTATTRKRPPPSSTPCNSRDATHGTCTDEPDRAPIHESTIANHAEPAGMSISPAEQTKLDSRRLRGSLLESLADPVTAALHESDQSLITYHGDRKSTRLNSSH